MVSSKPLTVDVERADIPTTLAVDPRSVKLRFVGDTTPLTIDGVFPGGKEIELTRSTKLVVKSANTSVVVVQNGILSAVGVGHTNVDVQYGMITEEINVTVMAGAR